MLLFQGRGQEARVHQVQRAGGPASRGLGNEPLEALQNDGRAPGEFATGWEVASEEVLVCSTPARQYAVDLSFGERVTLGDIVQVGHRDVRETEQC
jgi:hypothetical protein